MNTQPQNKESCGNNSDWKPADPWRHVAIFCHFERSFASAKRSREISFYCLFVTMRPAAEGWRCLRCESRAKDMVAPPNSRSDSPLFTDATLASRNPTNVTSLFAKPIQVLRMEPARPRAGRLVEDDKLRRWEGYRAGMLACSSANGLGAGHLHAYCNPRLLSGSVIIVARC